MDELSRRNGRRSRTNEPRPCSVETSPSTRSSPIAVRTLLRETPYRRVNSVSDGNASPALSSPLRIAARSASATCLYTGRSRLRSIFTATFPPSSARTPPLALPAAPERASLVLGHAAPHTHVLPRGQRPLEALAGHLAAGGYLRRAPSANSPLRIVARNASVTCLYTGRSLVRSTLITIPFPRHLVPTSTMDEPIFTRPGPHTDRRRAESTGGACFPHFWSAFSSPTSVLPSPPARTAITSRGFARTDEPCQTWTFPNRDFGAYVPPNPCSGPTSDLWVRHCAELGPYLGRILHNATLTCTPSLTAGVRCAHDEVELKWGAKTTPRRAENAVDRLSRVSIAGVQGDQA